MKFLICQAMLQDSCVGVGVPRDKSPSSLTDPRYVIVAMLSLVFHVVLLDGVVIYPTHMKSLQSAASSKSAMKKMEAKGLSKSSMPGVYLSIWLRVIDI